MDDDPRVLSAVGRRLGFEGFAVDLAASGAEALELAAARTPDLVILDVMLPEMNGLEIARRLRQGSPVPILMLTARDAIADRVAGLRSGADDYLVKPFAFEELLARVEALSRRPRAIAAPVLRLADLELDKGTRRVTRAGQEIELTPKEYAVLEYLMRHAGRVMSRTLITEYAWGYHFDPGTNIVDVVINHLRKKIDSNSDVKLIHTVRGVGYVVRA